MTWIDRLLGRTPPPAPAPPPRQITLSPRALAGGRLSLGSEAGVPFASDFATVYAAPASPETDWRRLNMDANTLDKYTPAELMMWLADLSPDVSKALWDFIRQCVSGWECKVSRPGRSSAPYPQAQELIDTFLKNLNGPYVNQQPGADVVFGMIFATMFLRGATLMELVLDQRGRVPLNIALVDPVAVRFRKVIDPVMGEAFELGQYQRGTWVAFDRPTILYVPVDPLPASPYGRPVANSALNTVIFLVAIMNDLRRVIQQQGWPRIDLSIDFDKIIDTMPPESDDPRAVEAWADSVTDAVIAVYNSLEPDEAYVHSANISVNRPVGAMDTASLGAVAEILRALERRVARALKTQPMFLGITESSTETQAIQQYEMQAAGIRSIQHRIETGLERLLRLALQVQGIVADVEFRFAELRASEAERYARTQAAEIANEIAKRDQGWITNDDASEAITGHPAVADPVPAQLDVLSGFGELTAEPAEDEEPDDPEERANLMRRWRRWRGPASRVTIRPDGSDEELLPLPDQVVISAADVDETSEVWDELMPEYAGMLDADYIADEDEERSVRRPLAEGENPWEYDARTRRYRDKRTGRFLGHQAMVDIRDDYVEAHRVWVELHAERLNAGEINIQQWERQFRRRLTIIHNAQYELGRGGRHGMGKKDWDTVEDELMRQYNYLHRFAGDIAEGKLSPATIVSRSNLYVEASTASYERGRAAAHNLVLPAYPGDGGTRCLTNCRCHWRISETEDAWNCHWTLGHAEHCEDCIQRSQTWAPYTYPKR